MRRSGTHKRYDFDNVPAVVTRPEGKKGPAVVVCDNDDSILALSFSTGCAPSKKMSALMEHPGLYFVRSGRGLQAGCTDCLLAAFNKHSREQCSSASGKGTYLEHSVFYGLALKDLAGGRSACACMLNMLTNVIEHYGRFAIKIKKHGNCGFGLLESEHYAVDELFDKAVALLHSSGLKELDVEPVEILPDPAYSPSYIIFQSRVAGHEILACGECFYEQGGDGIAISRGSHICRAYGKVPSAYSELEKRLKERGSLAPLDGHDDIFVLKEDLVFGTYTQAATFITGVQSMSKAGWGCIQPIPLLYHAQYAGHNAAGMMAVHKFDCNEMVQLLKGSTVMCPEFVSSSSEITRLKEKMLSEGALAAEGDYFILQDDLIFNSRTLAGTFITGTAEGSKELWANGTAKRICM